jgi:uncharacterized membrane protein
MAVVEQERQAPRLPLGRLVLSATLVLIGALMILVTVGFLFWPADIIIVGAVLVLIGAFFVQLAEPPRQ